MLLLNCQIVGEINCWLTQKGLYCVPATKHRGLFTLFPKMEAMIHDYLLKFQRAEEITQKNSPECAEHRGRPSRRPESQQWGEHTKNGPVRSACSCPSSLVHACLVSALYALGVKLLMWAITVILCLDKSSCMQLGVWVIIISTHYVWLASINERKKREKVIGQMSLFTRAWNQKENLNRLRTNECERKTFASQRGSVPSLFVD